MARLLPLVAALLLLGSAAAHAADLLVFAAASLKNALDEAALAWPGGARVRASYAATPALARQLEQGAPADLFIAADREWMAWAASRRLLREGTRRDLLGNSLVLIAPRASTVELALAPGADLAGALGDRRLALADPDGVPAGRYAQAAFERLGLWESLRPRLARAENVRAALAFVARGEAPLGVVYLSDAAAEPAVRIVARFPHELHPPIVYPAAVTAASRNEAAAAFLDFLASAPAAAIFERHGFTVLAPPPSPRS